MSNGQVIKFFF